MGGMVGQPVDDVGRDITRPRAVDAVGGGGHDDEHLDITLAELVGENLCSVGGFGTRVLKAAGGERLLATGTPNTPEGDRQQHRGDQDAARRGESQEGDSVKQLNLQCGSEGALPYDTR